MTSLRTGVLLVNVGTPDSPSTKDVRKYLREFLMDPYVIDIPAFNRFLLVNLIIAPFRAPKSAKVYRKIWDDEKGSPLLYHGLNAASLLQESLGKNYVVRLAMRYQSPSVKTVLAEMKKQGVNKLIVIPLFPQYAEATTKTVIENVNDTLEKMHWQPGTSFVEKFFDHPQLLAGFVENSKKYLSSTDYEHILFSYHGLPERQILKSAVDNYCQLSATCCATYHSKNKLCYRAQCFATSRKLAGLLDLNEEQYTVCFQSRLGRSEWIKPYLDDVIEDLIQKGIKKVLVFSPAFVADCIETTIEIGEEYKEAFMEKGGEKWDLVESLNENQHWINCLEELVHKH